MCKLWFSRFTSGGYVQDLVKTTDKVIKIVIEFWEGKNVPIEVISGEVLENV